MSRVDSGLRPRSAGGGLGVAFGRGKENVPAVGKVPSATAVSKKVRGFTYI